jgi:hypothetical protein
LRKRILHIVLSCFLLSNILFSQVILSFFHAHDEQDHVAAIIKKSGQNEPVITKHASECKVCSCDVLHELFYKESIRLDLSHQTKDEYQNINSDIVNTTPSFHQGRAPPVFSSYLI